MPRTVTSGQSYYHVFPPDLSNLYIYLLIGLGSMLEFGIDEKTPEYLQNVICLSYNILLHVCMIKTYEYLKFNILKNTMGIKNLRIHNSFHF